MSSLWSGSLRVGDESHSCRDLLHKGVGFNVGEENKVRFLVDDWLGVSPLLRVYPRLYRLASNKLSYAKDCYVSEERFVSWAVSFRRTLCQSEEALFKSLYQFSFQCLFCANLRQTLAFGCHTHLRYCLLDLFLNL